MCDVKLWLASTPVLVEHTDDATLLQCIFVSLTFSTQKNGTRGEIIGHGHSNNPNACPVRAIARSIIYLRLLNAPNSTSLCTVGPSLIPLTSTAITCLLRQACSSSPLAHGVAAHEITTKSLRASGAMALLNEGIDRQTIQLVGRWKSDAMLHYLHVQAHDLMSGFSSILLQGGNYSLIPLHPSAPLTTFT
jgi:hypothetical protein